MESTLLEKITVEKTMDDGVCFVKFELRHGAYDGENPPEDPEIAINEQDAIGIIKALSTALAEGMFD